MKLLQVATVPVTLQAFLLPFAEHFRAKGWTVDAAAASISQSKDCIEAFNTCHDIGFRRTPYANNIPKLLERIRKVVKDGGYDIVHVHTPIAAFLVRCALRCHSSAQPAIVYTAHGFHFGYSSMPFWLSPFFHLEKLAGKWTDALVVINRIDHTFCKAHTIVPNQNLFYVPGIGVDLNLYSKDRISIASKERVRAELGLSSSDFLVLMVAEFIPRKRHGDIIRALKLLGRTDVHLAFAGDGVLFDKAKLLARRLNVQKFTHFLGFRSDIPDLIAAADAATLVSDQEGLPRSVMECMAMKTLVIGTRTRGISELLEDDCGILVDIGDICGISRALDTARSLGAQRLEIVSNAFNRIGMYAFQNVIKEYETIYANVVNRARTAPFSYLQ